MMTAEELAGHIFDVLAGADEKDLPTTRWELAQLITDSGGPEGITTAQISHALEWCRDNSVETGWTIPNVRAGSSADRVYRVVPADADGYMTAEDAEAVDDGWRSRVEYAVTTWQRGLEPMRLAAERTSSKARRRELASAVKFADMALMGMESVLAGWEDD